MIFPIITAGLSLLSAAATSIATAVSSIGPAVAAFATNIVPTLARALEVVKPMLPMLTEFANALLRGMDILKAGETIEDLGARALQAGMQGMPLNKFDDVGQYLQALRDMPLDPRMKERSPVELVLAGLSIATVGLEEKYQTRPGSFDGIWLLPLLKPDYFTPERMQSLLETRTFGREVLDYFDGSLSGGQARNFEKSLETPGMSEAQLDKLYDTLKSASDAWDDLKHKISDAESSQTNRG